MRDGPVVAATLIASAAAVVLLMGGVLWSVRRTGRVTVVDTIWGLGFALIALVALVVTWDADGSGVRVLLTVLTVTWGVRLAVHIGRRSRFAEEDPRYAALFERHRGTRVRVAALWVCAPQAAALWFISLPVQLGQNGTADLGWWAALGGFVWAVGMAFETVADAQLARFRADPARKGTVLRTGLWRYSRHPNYFGDACVWWGIYLVGCSAWPVAFTAASPVLMTWTLARGTGKPLMERHLGERPGYADYVRRTSGFLPMPPRRR